MWDSRSRLRQFRAFRRTSPRTLYEARRRARNDVCEMGEGREQKERFEGRKEHDSTQLPLFVHLMDKCPPGKPNQETER